VRVDTVFLLSPAFCGGRRAAILLNPASEASTPRELRAGRLTLGQAFAFMSGLYFRGKLSYARRFGETLVITPTRGLQSPDLPVTFEMLREFAAGDVSVDNAHYRSSLERDARALAARLGRRGRVVLLGSVASGKYVDVLLPILGGRLRFPVDFVGRGDMSRGGLLLRSAAGGVELEYGPLAAGVRPRGPRPPKLDPSTRVPPAGAQRGGRDAAAVSWSHALTASHVVAGRGIVEPALRPGAPGAQGLDAVVDIRLRARPRVHGRPRS
jgi:hypothetical protein